MDELLRRVVFEAVSGGLDFARRYMLEGERVLDADSWYPDDLPSDERQRLLLFIREDVGLTPEDLEIHLGAPPIAADRRTHTVITGLLRQTYPHAFYVGEEANDDERAITEEAPEGAMIFTLDAIDGSQPYDTLTFGYSVNLLVHERGAGDDHLMLACIANSSGFVVIWEDPRWVWVGEVGGDYSTLQQLAQPLDDDVREATVAAVASTPRHRALVQPLLDDDVYTVFTTGGAPASLGLVLGRLESLVCTRPQTLHDAACLPILAALDIPLRINRQFVGIEEVRQLMSRAARPGDGVATYPVPAYIASRSPQAAVALETLLHLTS